MYTGGKLIFWLFFLKVKFFCWSFYVVPSVQVVALQLNKIMCLFVFLLASHNADRPSIVLKEELNLEIATFSASCIIEAWNGIGEWKK